VTKILRWERIGWNSRERSRRNHQTVRENQTIFLKV
jgi:hypothetical protein